MNNDLPSTGETQAIASVPEHRGFVDNCIALIENLLESRPLPGMPAKPTTEA